MAHHCWVQALLEAIEGGAEDPCSGARRLGPLWSAYPIRLHERYAKPCFELTWDLLCSNAFIAHLSGPLHWMVHQSARQVKRKELNTFLHGLAGSMNMSYDSSNLTTPDIKWLGVRPSDLDRFNIPEQCRLPMTDEDIKTGKKLVSTVIPSLQHTKQYLSLCLQLYASPVSCSAPPPLCIEYLWDISVSSSCTAAVYVGFQGCVPLSVGYRTGTRRPLPVARLASLSIHEWNELAFLQCHATWQFCIWIPDPMTLSLPTQITCSGPAGSPAGCYTQVLLAQASSSLPFFPNQKHVQRAS